MSHEAVWECVGPSRFIAENRRSNCARGRGDAVRTDRATAASWCRNTTPPASRQERIAGKGYDRSRNPSRPAQDPDRLHVTSLKRDAAALTGPTADSCGLRFAKHALIRLAV